MKNKRALKTATVNHSTENRRVRIELRRDGDEFLDKFSWVTTTGKFDTCVSGKTLELAVIAAHDSWGMDCWDLRIKGDK